MSRTQEPIMATRKRVWLTFLSIIVLGIFFGGIVYPQMPGYVPAAEWFNSFEIKQGLDLQGGAHLVYQADISEVPEAERTSAVEGVRDVIERRVNALGVSEPLVQTNKDGQQYRVIVELAGVFNINEAIAQIGETPLLEFKEQAEIVDVQPVTLTPEQEAEIAASEAAALEQANQAIVRLQAGEDFSSLATELSQDPTVAENQGDLGFATRGAFVTEFETVLFDELSDGEITNAPVKTAFGYHVIKRIESQQVTETQDGETVTVDQVHGAHILFTTLSETDFQEAIDPWQQTGLSGKHLKNAVVQFDQNVGSPLVGLTFNDEGSELFAQITERNLQKPVAIFLDGEPISIPVVQSIIANGQAVITGNFTIQEAKLLAQRLNAGALPVPIELVSQLQVGPSLGKESVTRSIDAGMWGLIFVMIFMVLVYRLPGLLADIALVLYSIILFGLFEVIPVTLTLAGITGFILSIGMAVDANILIFERMKEELRLGKSLDNALEEGFRRAWSSIRDSNISSLITAVILMWFGSSIIKGFALTLGIGIVVSMFSAITITRTLLRLTSYSSVRSLTWLFGVRNTNKQ